MASNINWVCDIVEDDPCSCSTNREECCCIAEPVCTGPLVGTEIALEVECRVCGAPMCAIDINTGESLEPQPSTWGAE